ncbi:MAG: NAD(P)-binding protein [Sphingomonadaceae bacterium]|nr:NAD(P)-binding protein [Sphingomonadaceae bacterium]
MASEDALVNDTPSGAEEVDFDPEALRARYRQERDKRIRDEGTSQYVAPAGELEHFVDDPYVEPGFTRDPLTDEVDILIVGGGFAGLSAGANLRKRGLGGIRFIEKAGDFGGSWNWIRDPVIQCEIES